MSFEPDSEKIEKLERENRALYVHACKLQTILRMLVDGQLPITRVRITRDDVIEVLPKEKRKLFLR